MTIDQSEGLKMISLTNISSNEGSKFDFIFIVETSKPFVLFSFREETRIAIATLLLLGGILGILGKFVILDKILQSPLSCPVNLLIFVDQVSVVFTFDLSNASLATI